MAIFYCSTLYFLLAAKVTEALHGKRPFFMQSFVPLEGHNCYISTIFPVSHIQCIGISSPI